MALRAILGRSRERKLCDRSICGLFRAGLRFHDPHHTFGSLAINSVSIVQVQAWMGHSDIKTTMRCLDHKSRADDARQISGAFRSEDKDLSQAALILSARERAGARQARMSTSRGCSSAG